METYNDSFYDYINVGALKSADVIAPIVMSNFSIKSVLDVGCGQGAWLSQWNKLGVVDTLGIDGSYVNEDKLLIPPSSFCAYDISKEYSLKRKFDLVQSLEVAEHISEKNADIFIANLVAHGNLILFSAAPKGQGGDHHVNEQSYDYWRIKFSNHGYEVFDIVRPIVGDNKEVEPWYRYNTFVYVSKEIIETMATNILSTSIPKNIKLRDISPFHYKLRKLVIRLLPYILKNKIAKLNEKLRIKIHNRL